MILKCFKDERLSNGEHSVQVDVASNSITVWCRSLYNNDYGTWTDINGEPISAQRSELTSHILDAVKDNLWFNILLLLNLSKSLLILLRIFQLSLLKTLITLLMLVSIMYAVII